MKRYLIALATLLFLGACAEVHPVDSEMSNIDVPRDGEGDVDEPTIE
jgi:PBP1b-binding outer membrane lipoprotein LpoB